MANLYLFTASYPFGSSETFIEDEIFSLAQKFSRVEITPLVGKPPQTREVPNNCIVNLPIIHSRFQQYTKGLCNGKAFCLFVKEFWRKRVYRNKLAIKTWFIAYAQSCNILKSKDVKRIISNICDSDVCYFYWGKGCNILAAFYPNKAHYVNRFHGEWDLWEESSGGYGPLRDIIARNLDSAVFISKLGQNYFLKKYPYCNTQVFPLGTIDMGLSVADKNDDNCVRVVSCSTVYPLKRVDLIYDSLCELSKKHSVKWTHIGDGPTFGELKAKVSGNMNEALVVELLGGKTRTEVLEIYKERHFDIFINLSTNEGVPVSIMEAISFGIPVVATNVGATSEIVQPEVGELVEKDTTPMEVAKVIDAVLNTANELHPREFWMLHYNAEKNYSEFSNYLFSLAGE